MFLFDLIDLIIQACIIGGIVAGAVWLAQCPVRRKLDEIIHNARGADMWSKLSHDAAAQANRYLRDLIDTSKK